MNIYDFENNTGKYIIYVTILIPIFLKLITEIAIYYNICRLFNKFMLFILIIILKYFILLVSIFIRNNRCNIL